jgi:hypothetical protein
LRSKRSTLPSRTGIRMHLNRSTMRAVIRHAGRSHQYGSGPLIPRWYRDRASYPRHSMGADQSGGER